MKSVSVRNALKIRLAVSSLTLVGSRKILAIQIAKNEERLKQLKAQKQAVLAREKARQKAQDRKDDTRRKILLGSYLLKKMEDESEKEKILADFNEYLTEDRDKKLFNL